MAPAAKKGSEVRIDNVAFARDFTKYLQLKYPKQPAKWKLAAQKINDETTMDGRLKAFMVAKTKMPELCKEASATTRGTAMAKSSSSKD